VADAAGECGADERRLSPADMIEHVVIYQFDASAPNKLSLSVDERVWVSVSDTVICQYC